jgi:HSP20 family protein
MTPIPIEMKAKPGAAVQPLARWTPFERIAPFAPFGRLFDDLWGVPSMEQDDRLVAPAIDVIEDEQGILVSAELPGLKKEDVKIQFENGLLTISGEHAEESEKKGRTYHRMERRRGAFYRALTLPAGVNPDRAEAEFVDGILKVRMPLREEIKPKVVKIK